MQWIVTVETHKTYSFTCTSKEALKARLASLDWWAINLVTVISQTVESGV